LEISDSYIYYPGESEISEALAREITTFAVPPTNYPEGLEISDSYIYYPGGSEISEAVVPNISTRLFYALKAIIAFFIRMSHGQGA